MSSDTSQLKSSVKSPAVPPVVQNLPLLPATEKLESLQLIKQCIPAQAALAAYSQCLVQTPIAALACQSLARLNAVGAAQLSGEPLSARDALIATDGHLNPAVKRYLLACDQSSAQLVDEPVGSNLALELAAMVSGETASVRRGPVTTHEPGLSGITPPVGAEKLQRLLDNWQGFIQQGAGTLNPLLLCAAAQGQWMAMRPFTAGNVMLGQLLTQLLLIEEQLLRPDAMLPLAHDISRGADRYWLQLQRAITAGERQAWCLYFLSIVESSARRSTELIMQWQALRDGLPAVLSALLPKPPSDELIDLCASPAFGISDLAAIGITRRQTAASWMQRLVGAGVLHEQRIGKEKRYINAQVVALLLPAP